MNSESAGLFFKTCINEHVLSIFLTPRMLSWSCTLNYTSVLAMYCRPLVLKHWKSSIILSNSSGWKANAAWEGKAAETAHQQHNNMTDDRPRGKSRPASRSARRACQRARCSCWIDTIPSLASGSCCGQPYFMCSVSLLLTPVAGRGWNNEEVFDCINTTAFKFC